MSKVLINVLNYNTYNKSCVCIDSCLLQKDCDYRILLIDNNSTDDSFIKLKEKYGEKIDYLSNRENYGFAKGNNIGVKYSHDKGYKYSFLLNSDTELVGDYLVRDLVKVIEKSPDCSVVAPIIYDVTRNGNKIHTNDSIYHKLLRIFRILPPNGSLGGPIEKISEAHGSALMVLNKVFLSVGGFPEHYFMYGEESTFAKKILWEKHTILRLNKKESYILHHHDKSGSIDSWRLFLMGRNRALEYYEYRTTFPLWNIVYFLFFLLMNIGRNPNNIHILNGMKEGKKLFDSNTSIDRIYELGRIAKSTY